MNAEEIGAEQERLLREWAPEPCRWFLRCENPATGSTSHPILGEVPTCDRCAAFAEGK